MALSALATEAKATALIAEARRCLAIGDKMKNEFLVDLINQLQLMTTTDCSARTDVSPNSAIDGRNAADQTTAGG
jgi:hypothetical protein